MVQTSPIFYHKQTTLYQCFQPPCGTNSNFSTTVLPQVKWRSSNALERFVVQTKQILTPSRGPYAFFPSWSLSGDNTRYIPFQKLDIPPKIFWKFVPQVLFWDSRMPYSAKIHQILPKYVILLVVESVVEMWYKVASFYHKLRANIAGTEFRAA